MKSGTEHGTVVSCIGIAVSVFVSITCMTLVAIGGNVIVSVLPTTIIKSLNYLLPALYGCLCVQRAMKDPKTFFVMIPLTVLCVYLKRTGVFKLLPLGGGYAQILLLVIFGALVAKTLHRSEVK